METLFSLDTSEFRMSATVLLKYTMSATVPLLKRYKMSVVLLLKHRITGKTQLLYKKASTEEKEVCKHTFVAHTNVWNFIEQEVVYQDRLVAQLTEWGPAYQLSLEVKINSFPQQSNWSEVLRVSSTYRDAGSVGDRIPAIFANKAGFIHICTQVGTDANWCKNFNISQGRWYMLELGQNKENTKVICINSRFFTYTSHPFSISMRSSLMECWRKKLKIQIPRLFPM